MKNVFLLAGIFLWTGCSGPQSEYVFLSGTIDNTDVDSVQISRGTYTKKLDLRPDGSFRDTLKVEKGYYTLRLGDQTTQFFLKNGYNLYLKADADRFDRTISYTGKGADNSNYIAEKIAFVETRIGEPKDYFILEKEQFESKVAQLEHKLKSMFDDKEELDSVLVANEQAINRRWIQYLTTNYPQQHQIYSGLKSGAPSPTFENYENARGGTTSFEELTGEYLYFTVWSTDCESCREEFPAIRKLRQKYAGSNINFVGISVDTKQRRERWRQVVVQQKMGGIQLHTGAGLYRKFIRDYNITSLPRHMLVDPEGNIITAYAPSPSDSQLKNLFEELGIERGRQ